MADNRRASNSKLPQRRKRDHDVEASTTVHRLSRRNQGIPPEFRDGLKDKVEAKKLAKHSSNSDELAYKGMIRTIKSLRRNNPPLLDTRVLHGVVNLDMLELNPKGRTQVVNGAISDVKFLPTADKRVVVVGDEDGYLGLWNVDFEEENMDKRIYVYHPHLSKVSGITIESFSMSKIFTSSYDQRIMLLDVEKEDFSEVYEDPFAIYSMCQQVESVSCIIFGDESGQLKIFDIRASTPSSSWGLHRDRINTIHCKPNDNNILATSSSDKTLSIWDLRSMNRDQPQSLTTISHGGPVYSAYFSPSGSFLSTTSSDNTVGLFGGENYKEKCLILHNNLSGEYISTLRGIWGWDDSHFYIGKIQEKQKHKRKDKLKKVELTDDKHGLDIISTVEKKVIRTLHSDYMPTIPYRLAAHPYMVGTLAAATGKGKVCMWVES